jgi:hypothetical protein
MEILFALGALNMMLLFAGWSCSRSYYQRGRLQGMRDAAREMIRGISSHYELDGQGVPDSVLKAVAGVKTISGKNLARATADPYEARFWNFGDAIGEACWRKGHGSGLRKREPAKGKLRIDLSLRELLQLSWLAHLGFRHMMPNYRGFEIHRFSGEQDAQEGAIAIGRIESAIPAAERPFDDLSVQLKGRQKLISDWWQTAPKRLTA